MNYLKKTKLYKKRAIIIGGLGLIGKEISKAIYDAGASIYILDKQKKPKNFYKFNSKRVKYIHFDVADTHMQEIFKSILKKFKPNIFINCSYPTTSLWGKSNFENITLKSMRENVDIHLNSYAWLAKLTAENMKKNKTKGSIIQFGSIYGLVAQDNNIYKGIKNMSSNFTYSMIKGGIVNLTRQMASYYGKDNIRINSICPGAVIGHYKEDGKKQNKVFLKKYKNKVPLKRLAKAEEIASVSLFLSSESASYITGSNLIVDGGWTAV